MHTPLANDRGGQVPCEHSIVHRVSVRVTNYFVHAPEVWQYRPERQSPNRRESSAARHTHIAL